MRRSIRYSQNFLRLSPFLKQLVARTSIGPDDLVLDIGAGNGILTILLSATCRKVIAIEADPRLASNLETLADNAGNIQVRRGDFLAMALPGGPYKVFANIPFNVTSAIVHKLLDSPNPPNDSYLIMQREAATKFAGEPGHQSLFAVLHAPWFAMEIMHRFRASDFSPEPSVATVLLRARKRTDTILPIEKQATYNDFVSYIFNHANPNVLPSLKKLFPGEQFTKLERTLGPNTTAKPSQLAFAAWITLFNLFLQSATTKQFQLIKGTASKLTHEASTLEKHHRTRSAPNWREVG